MTSQECKTQEKHGKGNRGRGQGRVQEIDEGDKGKKGPGQDTAYSWFQGRVATNPAGRGTEQKRERESVLIFMDLPVMF